MRAVRRSELTPRIEMTPLIDVIFLLLTFFIYSLVLMVRAQVLPVSLAPVTSGETAQPERVVAITIDRQGRHYLNRQPVTEAQLDRRLAELAAAESEPAVFIAMERAEAQDAVEPGADTAPAAPAVDRGPMLIALIERVQRAGLTKMSIVGDPGGELEP